MTDDVSKLPAFPEKPDCNIYGNEALDYVRRERDAYKERVKALKQYAQHAGVWCSQDSGHACTCGLDALLAACVRKEGR